MTTITAAQVKTLRERTGIGMMECKKALQAANGDMDLAIDNMRKSGQAKAAKRAACVAAEGVITIAVNDETKQACLLEVNCETDFVARDENFQHFVEMLAETALTKNSADASRLMAQTMQNGMTCEQARAALVLKIGENVQVRRIANVHAPGCVGSYLHSNRIGVLVAIDQNNPVLARDIAMHIAATNPLAIDADALPAYVLAKEREIMTAQAQASGKPAHIVEKMVVGRLKKFVKEMCLVHQPFVKNPDQTIIDLLKAANATISAFVRFEVGEGIEKQTVDLTQEVDATLKGSE